MIKLLPIDTIGDDTERTKIRMQFQLYIFYTNM